VSSRDRDYLKKLDEVRGDRFIRGNDHLKAKQRDQIRKLKKEGKP
jgi:hypothetical protein